MKFLPLLALVSVCLLPLGADAQWQWIDKDHKKVFSDQAPPPDIPDENILHRPAPRRTTTPAPGAPDVQAAGSAAPPLSPPKGGGVDKNLEEQKRKAEEAEKAKQAAESEKLAQAKSENCDRARQGKATLDSGMRVAQVDAHGERIVMDDDARAAEQKRIQSVIDSDCK
ncbi:MAG TPA: DUF4124 domain-containing protein [Variovorax sp.]|jgi:hypothetical protein